MTGVPDLEQGFLGRAWKTTWAQAGSPLMILGGLALASIAALVQFNLERPADVGDWLVLGTIVFVSGFSPFWVPFVCYAVRAPFNQPDELRTALKNERSEHQVELAQTQAEVAVWAQTHIRAQEVLKSAGTQEHERRMQTREQHRLWNAERRAHRLRIELAVSIIEAQDAMNDIATLDPDAQVNAAVTVLQEWTRKAGNILAQAGHASLAAEISVEASDLTSVDAVLTALRERVRRLTPPPDFVVNVWS